MKFEKKTIYFSSFYITNAYKSIEGHILDLINIMTNAAPPHKSLYRWDKRQSALDQPQKATKHGDKLFNLLERLLISLNLI